MIYGGSPYGSSGYGGALIPATGGLTTITKSLQYVVYVVPVTHDIQKSLAYHLGIPKTIEKPVQYSILLAPVTITKDLSYIIAGAITLPRSLQYAVIVPAGALQYQLQYVLIAPNPDGEDYSKDVTVSSHQAFPYTLWNNIAVGNNQVSTTIDVSQCSSIGFYLQVSAGTVINIQAKTADSIDGSGWTTYQTYTFDAAGSASFGIWFLPFTTMRLQVVTGVTITAEIFLRT